MGMREIAPFGVRMPPELKARIEAEARANGRSMNTEVVARLWESLQEPRKLTAMHPEPPAYMANGLSESEKLLLQLFRRMSPEKQLALLALFK